RLCVHCSSTGSARPPSGQRLTKAHFRASSTPFPARTVRSTSVFRLPHRLWASCDSRSPFVPSRGVACGSARDSALVPYRRTCFGTRWCFRRHSPRTVSTSMCSLLRERRARSTPSSSIFMAEDS
ncbi:hypothetical protein PENTCL1PPCAC_402, partial [Pristionchus entomophagus]